MTQVKPFTKSVALCSDWQVVLRDNVTDPEELCRELQLPQSVVSTKAAAIQPLNVTRDYLSRIRPGDPNDPLLLQILPRCEELDDVPGFSSDPLEELSYFRQDDVEIDDDFLQLPTKSNTLPHETPLQPLILQKYPGRALILMTGHCAANCRFCFRRCFPRKFRQFRAELPFFPFSDISPILSKKSDEISDLREIILSGGEPLMLDDTELARVFNYIKELYPGNRVRLHTRMPIMLPERVTVALTEILRDFRLSPEGNAVYVVLHVNHPNELSSKVLDAIAMLIDAGIPVFSQTVLLKNINDHFETLYDLFEKLVNSRITPYYLHQLDRVTGTTHFEVPVTKGLILISKLQAALPGYAVPRYVQEIPGKSHKTLL